MSTNSDNNVDGKTPGVNLAIGLVLLTIGVYLIFAEYININLPIWSSGTALQIMGLVGIAAYFITRPELRILSFSCVVFCFGVFLTLKRLPLNGSCSLGTCSCVKREMAWSYAQVFRWTGCRKAPLPALAHPPPRLAQ